MRPVQKEAPLSTTDSKRNPSQPAQQSDSPTVTQGGAMPGASESSNNENAYPRPDATQPGTLPAAIRESMNDPTGNQNREQLLVVAKDQKIKGAATMNRAELADALKATMSPTDLAAALTS
jgi:hypothetical protein